MRNELITLMAKSCTGATVDYKKTTVFAEKKSVARSEFYTSFQAGLSPKLVFDINPLDFELAATEKNEVSEVEYRGKTYKVIRSYQKQGEDSMELSVG